MPIIIKCPNCKEEIGIAETSLGKRVQCPICNKEFTAGKPKAEQPAAGKPAKPAPQQPSAPQQQPRPQPQPQSKQASQQQPQQQPQPQSKQAESQQPPPPAAPQRQPAQPAATAAPSAHSQPSQLRREPRRHTQQTDDAEPADAVQPENQWRQVIAIMLIMLFVALGTWGACEVQKNFSQVTAASTQELLANLKEAAAETDDARARKILWQVMTPEDQQLAQERRKDVEEYLINQHRHDKNVIESLDTQGLWLVCLRSSNFNAKNWKYTKTEMLDSKIGLLLFEDDFGNTAEIPIINTLHGWRAQVAAFCLKRIETINGTHSKADQQQGVRSKE